MENGWVGKLLLLLLLLLDWFNNSEVLDFHALEYNVIVGLGRSRDLFGSVATAFSAHAPHCVERRRRRGEMSVSGGERGMWSWWNEKGRSIGDECGGEIRMKRGEREWRADLGRQRRRPDVEFQFREIEQYGR